MTRNRNRLRIAIMLVVLVASLLATASAQAAPGDLDTSFGIGGKQTTDFGGGAGATSVAVQSDGKIVVVGGTGSDFALARYNTDGSLDTTFSGDGKQTTDFGGLRDVANGVAIQTDGKIDKIVVVGGSTGGFAVARYT
jgi:uncharacterized delta-60 repeat protein